MKKLFLLDAYALIYRAHFAFIRNPRINSKGVNTSAVFGFVNALQDVINRDDVTHLAVVFDMPGDVKRHEIFPEYKANRDETPEDIRVAIPIVKDILKAMDIPAIGLKGFEADDVIGTLAKKAEKEGFQTYMMTPDKDYAQLVSENIFMYKPGRSGKPAEVWGVPEVLEKFEIDRPEQVIDILAMWGDAVDNIPGIPGIGEKTSKKLVKKYGGVEGLLEHVDELKGKQKENVINNAEQAKLSKVLATIMLDVPVEFKEKELVISEIDEKAVTEIFSELEFRTLLRRVLKDDQAKILVDQNQSQMSLFDVPDDVEVPALEETSYDAKNVNYTLVNDEKSLASILKELEKAEVVCFDTETTGLDPLTAKLIGVALCTEPGTAYYINIPKELNKRIVFRKALQEFFENTNQLKIAHNVKYDLHVLANDKIEVHGDLYDTMIAHYLLHPDQRHGMDTLSELYLGYRPISIETLIGKKGKNQKSMADLPPEDVYEYACEDADITFQLYTLLKAEIEANDLQDLLTKVEMPLCRVLQEMEREGITLNTESLLSFSEDLGKELLSLQEKIITTSGVEDLNVDSPKQLGEALFGVMKIDEKAKKTKTGQYKTDEQTLLKLASKHPIIEDILNYRQLKKLKSTYVDALPKLVNAKTGRIHTTYMQTVAATGRLSSNNPNLQNIPIRSDKGKEIRKAFTKRNDDFILMAADYSQIELRIIAALSEDKGMIEAFKNGIDIHSATASKVFDVNLEKVTREMRSKSKMVNFGIIYGISAFGLSQRLNIPRKEAKEIIDAYFEKYNRVKEYMDECIEFARKNGYVETVLKRRRHLPNINGANAMERGFAERNAINAPIQGSAADIIKLAMINLHKKLKEKNSKSKLLLQVHDELVLDVHKEEIDMMKELVIHEMENAFKLSVPLDVEVGLAENWLEAH